MAKFHAKQMDGVLYELGHLDDFTMAVPHEDSHINVQVIFGCHCFTETFDGHHDKYAYTYRRERRAFCLDRYKWSHSLPGLIKDFSGKSVYHARHSNYFVVRTLDGAYSIFFDVLRARRADFDVVMNVQSAYVKDRPMGAASPVKFQNLLTATVAGVKPSMGPRMKVKRG